MREKSPDIKEVAVALSDWALEDAISPTTAIPALSVSMSVNSGCTKTFIIALEEVVKSATSSATPTVCAEVVARAPTPETVESII